VSWLLDTSVLVGVEQHRLGAADLPGPAGLSVVTLEELWLGVLVTSGTGQSDRRRTYEVARSLYDVIPVDDGVARACAEIRANGRGRGVRYSPLDSLIGATARVHGLPLLTQDAGMLGMLGVDVRVI
jgi:predicted nucleic acid-binding protein